MKIIRYKILNTVVDDINMQNALKFITAYVERNNNPTGFILAMGPEKAVVLRRNSFLLIFFESAALVIPY